MAAAQEDREEWEERRVALAAGDEQLQGGATTSTAPTWFTRPAVAVRIPGRTTVLTLYLTPRRDVLLGIRVVGSRVDGLSRVQPLPLTPARVALVEGGR